MTQTLTINQEGVVCFAGTHVPVRLLVNHLAKGYTIYEFLMGFPTVRRQQVIEFLETAAGAVAAVR